MKQDTVPPLILALALAAAFFIIVLAGFSWAYVEIGKGLDTTSPGSPLSLRLLFVACFCGEVAVTGIFVWWLIKVLNCEVNQTLLALTVPMLIIGYYYLAMMSFVNGCTFGSGFPLNPGSHSC